MDRFRGNCGFSLLSGLLAVVLVFGAVVSDTHAQRRHRAGSAFLMQQSQPSFSGVSFADEEQEITPTEEPAVEEEAADSFVDPAEDEAYAWDEGADDPYCGEGCDVACGGIIGGNARCRSARIYGGIEAVIVKPRFENNVAFSTEESDGSSFSSFSDTEFDYDLEITPRVFLGWQHGDGVGMRASWWQFDNAAAVASASPPANGFGEITHPQFGSVDISTVDPTDVFSATSELNVYAIDLELTKQALFCSWDLDIGCGVRYAFAEQRYQSQVRDDDNVLRGQIDYRQSLEGIGPTISLGAVRPLTCKLSVFGKARGSVLFGDGESSLNAGEDLDLNNSFTTTQATNRDDLLSIAEAQIGFMWQGDEGGTVRPFLTVAMEGQVWNGAGNATSEDGTLGFFGLNLGGGVDW